MFRDVLINCKRIPLSPSWKLSEGQSFSDIQRLFSNTGNVLEELDLRSIKVGNNSIIGRTITNKNLNLRTIFLGDINCENLSNYSYFYSWDDCLWFRDCPNLRSIYVGSNFVPPLPSWNYYSRRLIDNCPNLVGRKGSTFSNGANYQYCRIDEGPDKPGIFCGIYNAEVKEIPVKDAYFRGEKINKMIVGRDLINLEKEGN